MSMLKALQSVYRYIQDWIIPETEQELQQMREEMIDRFGPIPRQVEDLLSPYVAENWEWNWALKICC